MFKLYIGKGTVKTVGEFAIKQLYSFQLTFNYTAGYTEKLQLDKEIRNPFYIETAENEPYRLDVSNAKLIGFSHSATINHQRKTMTIELKDNSAVRYILARLLGRDFLIIKSL